MFLLLFSLRTKNWDTLAANHAQAGFPLARAFFWFDYPRANRLLVVYILETVAFHYRRNGVKMPYNGYNQLPIVLHSSRTSGYVPCSQDQQIS